MLAAKRADDRGSCLGELTVGVMLSAVALFFLRSCYMGEYYRMERIKRLERAMNLPQPKYPQEVTPRQFFMLEPLPSLDD